MWLLKAAAKLIVGAIALRFVALPAVFVVVLLVAAAGLLLAVPLLYVCAAFAAVAAGIGFGAVALPLYRRSESGPSDTDHVSQRSRVSRWRLGLAAAAMWATLVVAVGAVGYVLFGVFRLSADNYPWGTYVVIAVAALVGPAIVALIERAAGGSVLAPAAVSIAPGIAILAFAFVGTGAG